MLRPRRGIVLPAVLAVMLALVLLAGLALFDAVQEWRVATLAVDRVVSRAAALAALEGAVRPPALAVLCVSPPLAEQSAVARIPGPGAGRLAWRHLGGGSVLAEVTGTGSHRTRTRLLALLTPDSSETVSGLFRCSRATRLLPLGTRWVEGHPDG
jgi:hypothetical protein